jgi:ABC-type transport system involved in cytochrome c biogenesis permease component
MMKTNKMLVGLGLLATAIPPVVFAQVITRPANDHPEDSNKTLYLIIAVVVVLAVGAFLFFRSRAKK